MSGYLEGQQDYLFFIYGFSFFLLAAVSYILLKAENAARLPWGRLMLFGIGRALFW